MGMSTHVVGFRPPDERWHEMHAIYLACQRAKVPIPEKVIDFFQGQEPDHRGVEVDIKEAVVNFSDDYRQGFEVMIKKLPPDVDVIRFYNG